MSDTIIKMTGGVIRQQKNTILKDVNVEIKSGEFVYLIGKVGSGKSSFLKTLYAELPLEYGTAEVAGCQLKKIKKSQIPLLRRKCGIVFQDFKLLIDRNVYANLEFVLKATGWTNKKAIRERIETVLTKVDMLDKQHKMPHQLSGGEQQRIVLARALLNAPPIILADEPTGNIDPETSYRLIELLKEICDTGKTIVIATHQYDLIERYPGRVLCCSNGELFEKCAPATSQAIIAEDSAEISHDLPEITEEPDNLDEPTCLSDQPVPNEDTETVIITEAVIETNNISLEEQITENNLEENDMASLIGELTFPEVSAFDYEIGNIQETVSDEENIDVLPSIESTDSITETEIATALEEVKNINFESPKEEEKVSSLAVEKESKTKKQQPKNTPPSPTFDLELD